MTDPKIRRAALFVLKIAVSAALLAFVVMQANLAGYAAIVSGLSAAPLVAVIAIIVLQMAVISAWRLKTILAVMGSSIDVFRAGRVTWCGFFVEQVGALFVTGDIARILLLRAAAIDLKTAIEGPLLDRLIGLAAIAAMASAGMPYLWAGLAERQRGLILWLALAGILGMVLLTVLLALFSQLWSKMADTMRALLKRIFVIAAGLAAPYSRRRVAAVALLAFSTHALNVVAMYLLLGAVGVQIGIVTCFMVTPTVLLVSMLPASISGWGVREGALVVALQSFDLPPEQVIAASVLFGFCVLAASLPGALIWLSLPDRGRANPAA